MVELQQINVMRVLSSSRAQKGLEISGHPSIQSHALGRETSDDALHRNSGIDFKKPGPPCARMG